MRPKIPVVTVAIWSVAFALSLYPAVTIPQGGVGILAFVAVAGAVRLTLARWRALRRAENRADIAAAITQAQGPR